MTTGRLWDSFSGSWSQDSALGSSYEFGNRFQVSADGNLTEIAWYRNQTTSGNKPSSLRVWNDGAGTVLYTAGSIPDNGQVGWQRHTVSGTVAITAGTTYIVSAQWAAGNSEAYISWANTATPDYPLSWVGTRSRYHSPNGAGKPDADTVGAVAVGLDAQWTGPTGSGTGATISDVASARDAVIAEVDSKTTMLLSMVSNESTPSQYSIPAQTLDEVQDASTGLGAIKGAVDTIATSVGSALETAVSNVASDVSDIVTSVGADLVGAVTTGFATTAQLASDWANWAGAFTVGWTDWLAGAAESWADLWTRLLTGGGALPPQVAVPGTGWAQVATIAFTDDIAWAQPADLYVVTFLDVGANDTTTLVSGVDVVYRLAWWLPINGTETVGQRRFIDTPSVELTDGGARMPGILLHCPRGGAGTIDAWQYTP